MAIETQRQGPVSSITALAPRGFAVWFTGLPGAGKTTIAEELRVSLESRGSLVDHLDGDVLRPQLSSELGFSRSDREINVARIAWVASRLVRAGAVVLVSLISPYDDSRRASRALIEPFGEFIEVHVATRLEECIRRDPKGLYRQALRGERVDFTGISAPYEPPDSPELRLDTEGRTPGESARRVLSVLENSGLCGPLIGRRPSPG